MRVRAQGRRFVDEAGRQVILRGVNLGGDCKVPWPDGGTDRPGDFADHRDVSFIGRPFPLDEAHEHLARIAGWGFNCLRLLTTWEAVEHAGPGQYDEAYLDDFAEIARRAGAHGLQVFVDFHQDVWSRMTGGDGAPGWIFEALGLDFTRFHAAGAAHVMQWSYDYLSEERRQEDRYPMMSWSRNYQMPANGICWTAFFAGRQVTPDWMVGGRNVQDFLQGHYFGAMQAVARKVADLPNVMGFDSLNEPGSGWIGRALSYRHIAATDEVPRPPRPGLAWSPLDGLAVAAGLPRALPRLAQAGDRVEVADNVLINPDGERLWMAGGPDPFERAGVWSREGAKSLMEDAFRLPGGESGFMTPFFEGAAKAIRAVRGDWLLFAEVDPYAVALGHGLPQPLPAGTVNANHWYDIRTLGTKTFDPSFDNERLRARYVRGLRVVREAGDKADVPTLIGEFGIPYDLNGGEAYARWQAGERDVWAAHETALALMYDAMDELMISSTQWNYTASNRNDLRIGDGWNQEDLSIFSRDQQGGRAVAGFSRPYVRAAQGRLVSQRFDWRSGVFEAVIDADPAIAEPSELAAPSAHYPMGPGVSCDPPADIETAGGVVRVRARTTGPVRIRLE